jgi:hypothetical protein
MVRKSGGRSKGTDKASLAALRGTGTSDDENRNGLNRDRLLNGDIAAKGDGTRVRW